jgi:hypothetical protein
MSLYIGLLKRMHERMEIITDRRVNETISIQLIRLWFEKLNTV